MQFGAPELLILLVIVILLFGVGRVGQIGGELGRAIHDFRQGLSGDIPAPPSATPTPPQTDGVPSTNRTPNSGPSQ